MSVKLVAEEIDRYLKSTEPEVMCIMGRWGVGKTFAWNQFFKKSNLLGDVGLNRYSYVSLFGLNSLEDLKYSIFENTCNINKSESNEKMDDFQNVINFIGEKGRKIIGLVQQVPKIKEYVPEFLSRSFFLMVRNQIICIDDLERAGDGLMIKDVLGLVSLLKDQRNCKVVLLLNDEELIDKEAIDFKSQLEKVVDVAMRFEPTPQEAAEIGVDQFVSFQEKLKCVFVALEIVNIRVIRKIYRLAKRLEELLSNHDPRVFETAIPSIVLFGWSVFQPNLAPSLGFIKDYKSFNHLFSKSVVETEQEKDWKLLLGAINFSYFDEFDQLLLESVQRGYFDSDAMEKAAIEFDKKLELQDKDNSLIVAWSKYHNSFANNESEVLDGMFEALKKGVDSISPQNLDGTISFFRKMDRDEQADQIISLFMSQRNEKPSFYDPSRSSFLNFEDATLRKSFSDKLASFKDDRNPKDILIKIAQSNGWNPEDTSRLAQISPEQFYKIFKETEGEYLSIIVNQALKFGASGNSDNTKIIAINAEKALRQIAKESKINKERVLSYGISLEDVEPLLPLVEENK